MHENASCSPCLGNSFDEVFRATGCTQTQVPVHGLNVQPPAELPTTPRLCSDASGG